MNTRKWLACGALLGALLWSGCGGASDPANDAGAGRLCEVLDPPAACGKPCEEDFDCPVGLHCDPCGVCDLDCTRTGSECGTERYCDDRGRCQSEDTPPLDGGAPDGGSEQCLRAP
ncbi:hypothetical protein [Haliangium ochraceum]|uniref:IGFBP N-terminal domain-containing protein n=1 Tax=Haliangium ochraceum (strain DSM 14365 / JCM 11303 / SMP-2) TaxID=502025 RepID=D0LY53_HALO1|nr:hypothetical protein [Haliangium ochraceum]ACY16203.1 hypothetical protein Hoch_3703 [Haliangium ochraceum DSM 14365]